MLLWIMKVNVGDINYHVGKQHILYIFKEKFYFNTLTKVLKCQNSNAVKINFMFVTTSYKSRKINDILTTPNT